jgi:hypothetical protein
MHRDVNTELGKSSAEIADVRNMDLVSFKTHPTIVNYNLLHKLATRNGDF